MTTLMIVEVLTTTPPLTVSNTVVVASLPPTVSVTTDCSGAETVTVAGSIVLVTTDCDGARTVMVDGIMVMIVVVASLPTLFPTVTVTT